MLVYDITGRCESDIVISNLYHHWWSTKN